MYLKDAISVALKNLTKATQVLHGKNIFKNYKSMQEDLNK